MADKCVFNELFDGENKNKSGEKVSVFLCSGTSHLESAKMAIKKLKTMKHPSILTYIDSSETENSVLLATERVKPLYLHLEQDLDDYRGPKRYLFDI